jgi:PPOX class probable F420-dependent enzyme
MRGLYNHSSPYNYKEEGIDMASLAQFDKQNYLNIETFRKNGIGVKTPVWFAMENGNFYIGTEGNTGKMKRVRNNGRVRIVPCRFNGEVLGEWIEGRAIIVEDEALKQHIVHVLTRKYGLPMLFYAFLGRFSKGKNGYLHVIPA